MFQQPKVLLCLAVFSIACWTVGPVQAIDIVWDGGDGTWNDANWNGGDDPFTLVGKDNGTNGYGGALQEEETFLIGTGSTVTYEADVFGDFQVKQGGNLIIRDGAVWQQLTDDSWPANNWTQMDASNLTLDNGTFRRIGSTSQERGTGGAMIFGSWRADDNFAVSPLSYADINISITNGGRLENDGELWFGSWDDTPAGTRITMTIDNGSVDLTGGTVPADDEAPAWGDLVFTSKFNPEIDPEEFLLTYAINFTGPGSLTVDRAGIINAYVDDNGQWTGFDPVSYRDLWAEGILQANGMSGVDGANFDDYFTESGSLGSDNYTLTSTAGVIEGDYNNNQDLDAGDLDLQAQAILDGGPLSYDLNQDGAVDFGDREDWLHRLKVTWVGDSNLDGKFDTQDFVEVLQAGLYETGQDAGWATGDWNGDLRFGTQDLVVALQEGGYEAGPYPGGAAVRAVPEPGTLAMILAGLAGLLVGAHRRRK